MKEELLKEELKLHNLEAELSLLSKETADQRKKVMLKQILFRLSNEKGAKNGVSL